MTMPIIPDRFTEAPSRNHFPIIMQLAVLLVVLGGMFGLLTTLAPKDAPLSLAQDTYTSIPLYATTITETPLALAPVAIKAEAAYVFDVRSQRALYKKNETDVLPLASITKLMTALLTHELTTEESAITVPSAAVAQSGNSGLRPGEVLSTSDLTQHALVSSSNDAAYALAATVGALLGERDDVAQFVAGMNIRADELGLSTLEFKNMTGLDESTSTPGAVGSAKDVSFLLEYIIEHHPDIMTATQEVQSRTYNDDGYYHELSNTNMILQEIPNLIGSKTGYTDLAGGNLTVAFDLANDRPIIITVLGSTRDARFSDVLTLVEAVEEAVNANEL